MTNKTPDRKTILEYVLILAGGAIMAIGINSFYDANQLVTGGVTGLAIIVHELTKNTAFPFPLWLTNIVLNIPLFILGAKTLGRRFLIRTSFATIYLSATLYFARYIPPVTTGDSDLILIAIFGGVLSGVGLGLVFRSSATTGGSDLAASIVQSRLKHISVSRIMFVVDSLIILLGLFVFGPTKAMYAVVSVYISSKIIEAILEGLSFAKAAFIISSRPDDIAGRLLHELERGATGLHGRGLYTGLDKMMILCVVSSKEVVNLKEIVHEIDPGAFVIVTDVREVMGVGFSPPETH